MEIKVNGNIHETEKDTTVEKLINDLENDSKGIAVAVNGKVSKKADWPSTVLKTGDEVLIIKAAYGG